jgi:hypothetical protein
MHSEYQEIGREWTYLCQHIYYQNATTALLEPQGPSTLHPAVEWVSIMTQVEP